jgi:hypothetical protein
MATPSSWLVRLHHRPRTGPDVLVPGPADRVRHHGAGLPLAAGVKVRCEVVERDRRGRLVAKDLLAQWGRHRPQVGLCRRVLPYHGLAPGPPRKTTEPTLCSAC